MKLPRHKREIKLPESPEGCDLRIWESDSLGCCGLIVIEQVAADILARQKRKFGMPTTFSIRRTRSACYLRLWPVPDQDYTAQFSYSPPRKKL